MLKLFKKEIQKELANYPPVKQGVFSEADLATLPASVQRCLRVCGWIGRPKMSNVALSIGAMRLKMDLDMEFSAVSGYQFNSVLRPVRIAYLKSSIWGFIPFTGRDKYQDGHGHMYIKVMDLIPVVDLKGVEMDKAALVTVLAETFLAPSYALQPYMAWQEVDHNTAIATITFNDTQVGGTFYFKDNGELERFETMDRYMSQKDGSLRQAKWRVAVSEYQPLHGVVLPRRMTAWWFVGGEWKQYAEMEITGIRYDVQAVDEVLFRK